MICIPTGSALHWAACSLRWVRQQMLSERPDPDENLVLLDRADTLGHCSADFGPLCIRWTTTKICPKVSASFLTDNVDLSQERGLVLVNLNRLCQGQKLTFTSALYMWSLVLRLLWIVVMPPRDDRGYTWLIWLSRWGETSNQSRERKELCSGNSFVKLFLSKQLFWHCWDLKPLLFLWMIWTDYTEIHPDSACSSR